MLSSFLGTGKLWAGKQVPQSGLFTDSETNASGHQGDTSPHGSLPTLKTASMESPTSGCCWALNI